jgi:hypothetical protein
MALLLARRPTLDAPFARAWRANFARAAACFLVAISVPLYGARRRPAVRFDYTARVDPDGRAKRVLRPALKAVGVEGVRLHDTSHTFAALQLSAGVHFMQVSKWLGHATYTLTLNTYGEWIPAEDVAVPNNLPEPKPAKTEPKVVNLFG